MQYDVSFGRLARQPKTRPGGQKFRLAVLGDFSGRANAGLLETGAALGQRKPLRVDVDNLDDIIARQKLSITLELGDAGAVRVPVGSMDDFHPDQLVDNVEFFGTLRDLRRNLASKAGFDRASREILSWSGEEALPPAPRMARGAAVATDRKLSDFARLTGRAPARSTAAAEADVDDLVRRLVGPFVQPGRDARQDQLTARVDEALSAAMRRVLHHPDFQAAEAAWRGVEFLVRRVETGASLQIVLYDVSAEELAADLAATDALDDTGLYTMLVEAPALDAQQGPFSAVLGLYGFELSPPHADLLGRVAKVAAAAGAPFLSGIGPDALSAKFTDQHPLIREAWGALQDLPESAYLGLATPRFLLRMPYGKKSDPIDAFAFEEFSRQSGLSGMLWGHPALLAGLLMCETYQRSGAKMALGSVLTAGDMPYYVYTGIDGEAVALPCTERLMSERQAANLAAYHVMPVVSLRGRPEVRLAGFTPLAGGSLAGFWAPVTVSPAPPPAPAAPAAAPAPADPTPPTPEPDIDVPPAPSAEAEPDLDALLAGLAEPAAAAPPAPAEEESELDKLLASLSAEAPPAAPDATEPDLDALLASLQ